MLFRSCSEYEARLEDYLSGQLSGADAREVAEHLARCSACRTAAQQAAPLARWLALAEPTPDPGPGFARLTMARIRTEVAATEAAKGFWQPFIVLAWRFAATATIALAAMLSYGIVRQRRQPTQTAVAMARASEMRDLFTTDTDRVPSNRDDVLIMVAEAKHGNH